jgi:branched-chain amino acid transport system permease protein
MTIIQVLNLNFVEDEALREPSLMSEDLIDLPGGRVSPAEILLVVVALVIALGVHYWTKHTRSGLAAVGISEDKEAAQILGVNTLRFSYLSFMASGVLGFAAAMVIGPKTFAIVALAATLTIKGFIALAIGGLGSSLGALMAGLGIGIVELLIARYFGASWQNTAVFIIFITVMLIRPRGLFGEALERAV